jgi:molecular chaperone GrpE
MTPKAKVNLQKLNELKSKHLKNKNIPPVSTNNTMKIESNNEQNSPQESNNIHNNAENIKKDNINENIYINELKEQLKLAKAEAQELQNQKLRIAADLQNLQKQNELETSQIKKRTKKTVVQTIMPFVNTLYLALNFKPKSDDKNLLQYTQTIETSFNKLINDLASINVNIITPKSGDLFDPNTMIALNSASDESAEITVKQVVSLGVQIDSQIIQPASIMI